MNEKVKALAPVRTPFFVSFLSFQVLALALWRLRAPIDRLDLGVYGLSVASAAALWFLLNLLRDAVRGWGRTVLAIGLAMTSVGVAFGQSAVYLEFGELSSVDMLRFMSDAEGGGLTPYLRYLEAYANWLQALLFVSLVAGFAALWRFGATLSLSRGRSRTISMAATTIVLLVTVIGAAPFASGRRLSIEGASMVSALHFALTPEGDHWHRANRMAVPALPEREEDPPNIVLIINESWQKNRLSFYDTSSATMPRLREWIENERNQFFIFERAYANATITMLSLPSILTGLSSAAGVSTFHRMPLLWDWARAAGMTPLFVSPKAYNSHDLDDFMNLGGLRLYHAGRRSPDTPRDTTPVTEQQAVSHFRQLLTNASNDGPFLAVYLSGTTHQPIAGEGAWWRSAPTGSSPYARALWVLDNAIWELVESMRTAGVLNDTLFILTSDHGSALARRHSPPRASSFYEEFVNIPFVVRVPERWLDEHPERLNALRLNRRRIVSNSDVVASLVDVMGFPNAPSLIPEPSRALWGKSFYRILPAERTLILNNTNEVRRWEHEVFGIFWRDQRFLFSDIGGARLFDLRTDPLQRHNRWAEAPDRVRRKILSTIGRHHHLQRIWESYRHEK